MTSARGKPFHCNAATSKEYTGVFSLFASFFFHCTCILHYPQAILLCVDLSVMIWCDIPLTERPSGVKRGGKKTKQPNYIVLIDML